METKNITDIVDYGEMGFKDVKIETLLLKVSNKNEKEFNYINIKSLPKNINLEKRLKDYIFSKLLPY
jgi:hypothetical protein